jgi:polysaccharide export outer membrane protein
MRTDFSKPIGRALLMLAAALGASCATGPEQRALPAPETSPAQSSALAEINQSINLVASQSVSSASDYRIGPEDLLQITIFNIPEQDARATPRTMLARVSQKGAIVLPMVGPVPAKGKTTVELEQALTKSYARYVRQPQIGVMVTEYRQRVSVMGSVQKPGVFELTGPKTVIDMLALAGGVGEKAGNQVHVYRQEAEGRKTYVIDLVTMANNIALVSASDNKDARMMNMPVEAGDLINVPQAGMYFVDGAVGKPGSYPLGRRYTLTQALATAGGVDKELADYSGVSIYRRQNGSDVKTIPVDLNEVRAGGNNDPQIEPDDVIVVPMSGAKYFVKRFVGTIISGFSIGAVGAGS